MVQATFDEPLPAQLANDMSTGYVAKQGALEPFGFEFIKNFGPAGALSASADAMAKFMRAHLNGGATEDGRILEPETVVQMHSALHRQSVWPVTHLLSLCRKKPGADQTARRLSQKQPVVPVA